MLSLKLSVNADRNSSFWLATETASAATDSLFLDCRDVACCSTWLQSI